MENLNYVCPDLVAHGVPVEVHTFSGVPHGQAGIKLLDGEIKYSSFELWLTLAGAFLQICSRSKRERGKLPNINQFQKGSIT